MLQFAGPISPKRPLLEKKKKKKTTTTTTKKYICLNEAKEKLKQHKYMKVLDIITYM